MKYLSIAVCAFLIASPAVAQQGGGGGGGGQPAQPAQELTWPGEFLDPVEFKLQDGMVVGKVMVVGYPTGVFFQFDLNGMEDGAHGVHLHDVGECVENFASTGNHVNPTNAKHGFEAEGGPHAGDLMNVYVFNGVGKSDQFNPMVTLADLNDQNGTSILFYRSPDDYQTQSEDFQAGGQQVGRLACAVLFPPKP